MFPRAFWQTTQQCAQIPKTAVALVRGCLVQHTLSDTGDPVCTLILVSSRNVEGHKSMFLAEIYDLHRLCVCVCGRGGGGVHLGQKIQNKFFGKNKQVMSPWLQGRIRQ